MVIPKDPGPSANERPSGYSNAVSAGSVIAVAGQIAEAAVIERREGFTAEFASALQRLVAALEAVGGRPSDLIHIRIFVTDLAAYSVARGTLAGIYRDGLEGHYPAATLVEVRGLVDGAAVELDGLAVRPQAAPPSRVPAAGDGEQVARIRLRFGPSDARYARGLVPGAKALEIFGDLETELSLLEGGDEGLCVAYDTVEFLEPLHVGDFVEATARVVSRGRTSRRIHAELFKVAGVDVDGVGQHHDPPILAASATATIVVRERPAGELR
jgi:3-aminobutyryl-CoA ammonia-lyase